MQITSNSGYLNVVFIPQNIFLLQKYNFYMKAANKSTEILLIKIYLLLLQRNYHRRD